MTGAPIWRELGRVLVIAGIVLVALGLLLLFTGRIPGLGRLPGDLVIHRGRVTVFLPLTTSIVLSLLLTLLINVFLRR
jgi:hypothetical protein